MMSDGASADRLLFGMGGSWPPSWKTFTSPGTVNCELGAGTPPPPRYAPGPTRPRYGSVCRYGPAAVLPGTGPGPYEYWGVTVCAGGMPGSGALPTSACAESKKGWAACPAYRAQSATLAVGLLVLVLLAVVLVVASLGLGLAANGGAGVVLPAVLAAVASPGLGSETPTRFAYCAICPRSMASA